MWFCDCLRFCCTVNRLRELTKLSRNVDQLVYNFRYVGDWTVTGQGLYIIFQMDLKRYVIALAKYLQSSLRMEVYPEMPDYTSTMAVADAGFIEGGSVIVLRAKILGPRPLLPKTTPISSVFERSFFSYLLIPSFLIEIFAKAC